ncbi:MAG: DnaJ domain-containing protein [Deltaproteobacteria bacterium]|nr:DnaJ domain-containing protein [Deltaproteobacteria bacterium]
MQELNEQEIIILSQVLEQLNYYQVLKISPDAGVKEVKEAFHSESRKFHPDTVYHLADGPLKDAIFKISKRITEAYVILRDSRKRRQYDRALKESGGKKVRYTEETEKEKKKAQVEQVGKTPQGRKAYMEGMRWMKMKKYQLAEKSFRTALMYEPGNPKFKRAADEANKAIGMDRFKIK